MSALRLVPEQALDWCERDSCIGLPFGEKRLRDGRCVRCGQAPPTPADQRAVCACGRAFELAATLAEHAERSFGCRAAAARRRRRA